MFVKQFLLPYVNIIGNFMKQGERPMERGFDQIRYIVFEETRVNLKMKAQNVKWTTKHSEKVSHIVIIENNI